MSPKWNKGSLSIGSKPSTSNSTEQTIGNTVWRLTRNIDDIWEGYKLRCLSISALDPGHSIKVAWTSRWIASDRSLWCLDKSGTHVFDVNSDSVHVSPYYIYTDCTLTVEFKILEEVHPIVVEEKRLPVIVSSFDGINSKDGEAIMALPMQERPAAHLNNPSMSSKVLRAMSLIIICGTIVCCCWIISNQRK